MLSDDRCIEQLESSGEYRVIRRFNPVDCYHTDGDSEKRIGIYLDIETTGLDLDSDSIIEIALVPFEYDAAGRIYRVLPGYNSFQDPGHPIPELATEITGITDEMVRGQSIDRDAVAKLLAGAVIVIAHNARFDRPFCERFYPGFEDIAWGCSIADVDWNAQGVQGVKLEYLAYLYGFFYEGHRATIDCQAGIEVLSRRLPKNGELVLKNLLENARRTDVRLWAEGAPFEMKDELKKRGYRWSPGGEGKRKAWFCDIKEDRLDDELSYLSEHIYPRAISKLPMDRFNAKVRYSTRI